MIYVKEYYLSDICNLMHMDDDASDAGKEHEEYRGSVGTYFYRLSYHCSHEQATTRAWESYEYEFDAIIPNVSVSLVNESASAETLWCA